MVLRIHDALRTVALTLVREHHGRESAERGETDDMGVWRLFWDANNYKLPLVARGALAPTQGITQALASTAQEIYPPVEVRVDRQRETGAGSSADAPAPQSLAGLPGVASAASLALPPLHQQVAGSIYVDAAYAASLANVPVKSPPGYSPPKPWVPPPKLPPVPPTTYKLPPNSSQQPPGIVHAPRYLSQEPPPLLAPPQQHAPAQVGNYDVCT